MKIAIIGADNVGRAVGGAWRAGHDITYGVRSPDYGVRSPDDPKHADSALQQPPTTRRLQPATSWCSARHGRARNRRSRRAAT